MSTPLQCFPLHSQWWTLGHRDTGRQRTLNIQQMAGALLNLPMSLSPPKHKGTAMPGAPLHPLTRTATPINQIPYLMLLSYDGPLKTATKTLSIILEKVSLHRGLKVKSQFGWHVDKLSSLSLHFPALRNSPLLFLSSSPSGVCSSRQ